MPSIIPQPLATDRSHGRAKIAAIYVKVFVIDDDNLSSSPAGGANMGPGAGAGPGAQGAHHWGSPAPDRQWPGTNAPAVIQPGDGRPGADTTLSWSHDEGRTSKKINVSGVPARVQKGIPARKPMSASTKRNSEKCISQTLDEGMAPLATIEHSLMDTGESPSSVL